MRHIEDFNQFELNERKKAKAKPKAKKEECEGDECDDKPAKKGLTAKQRKLPPAFQKAILKKQGKK
jgi:hypothetical protein